MAVKNKRLLRDIAKALLYSEVQHTDGEAFVESELLVNDDEQEFILEELRRICAAEIGKLESKYGEIPTGRTKSIILKILYDE